MSITFKELEVTASALKGNLNSLEIRPLPVAGSFPGAPEVFMANRLFIYADLPGLGTPMKLPEDPGPGGPGGGQYIEVLIDDEPRSGRTTAAVPYAMDFQRRPEHPEPDEFPENWHGTHMLHFMVSAGDGLCVKDPGYVASRVVHIKEATSPSLHANGPIIIYNLPRASHYPDEVTLDFALVNVTVNEDDGTGRIRIKDYRVRVVITDENNDDGVVADELLDYYHPYRILGLAPDGDYTIRLALVFRSTGQELPANELYSRTKPRAFHVREHLPPAP